MVSHSVDWEAYGFLQVRYQESPLRFTKEACDHAMSAALKGSNSKASSYQLSKNLYRNGKRRATVLNSIVEFNDSLEVADPPYLEQGYSLLNCTDAILKLFNSLSTKQKQALTIALQGFKSTRLPENSKVKARQFRNILSEIRAVIQNSDEYRLAFDTGIYKFGLTADFFTSLLKKEHE
jgi:hypothetical protein